MIVDWTEPRFQPGAWAGCSECLSTGWLEDDDGKRETCWLCEGVPVKWVTDAHMAHILGLIKASNARHKL
jgi:hypothetical protein